MAQLVHPMQHSSTRRVMDSSTGMSLLVRPMQHVINTTCDGFFYWNGTACAPTATVINRTCDEFFYWNGTVAPCAPNATSPGFNTTCVTPLVWNGTACTVVPQNSTGNSNSTANVVCDAFGNCVVVDPSIPPPAGAGMPMWIFAIAAIAALLCCFVFICLIWRRRKRKQREAEDEKQAMIVPGEGEYTATPLDPAELVRAAAELRNFADASTPATPKPAFESQADPVDLAAVAKKLEMEVPLTTRRGAGLSRTFSVIDPEKPKAAPAVLDNQPDADMTPNVVFSGSPTSQAKVLAEDRVAQLQLPIIGRAFASSPTAHLQPLDLQLQRPRPRSTSAASQQDAAGGDRAPSPLRAPSPMLSLGGLRGTSPIDIQFRTSPIPDRSSPLIQRLPSPMPLPMYGDRGSPSPLSANRSASPISFNRSPSPLPTDSLLGANHEYSDAPQPRELPALRRPQLPGLMKPQVHQLPSLHWHSLCAHCNGHQQDM
eukprot:TRINITY_DN3965_c0_g1_i8.p1 TRINITY_DN3965_c0_g1~~TRINITY_DN3965_c0_g1_i8.p1  ORF type:complete len:501 (+),score=92.66 TRINITY_DN3965_c0_g1_i8:49-1503(+)